MSTTIYVLATEDGKIDKCSLDPVGKDYVPYEVDDAVGPDDLWQYQLEDGKLVKDENIINEYKQMRAANDAARARAAQLDIIMNDIVTQYVAAMTFSSASAATKVAKFATLWSSDSVSYTAGSIVIDPYDNNTYICNDGQSHTSQPGWDPHLAPSLWSLIKIAPDGNREWVTPTGAHNDYEKGERCWYPDYETGKLYTSKQNGNVWPPTEEETSTWTL